MKVFLVDDTVVDNIRNEVVCDMQFKLNASSVKTYTEEYVNHLFTDNSNNYFIDFQFIDMNRSTAKNVEIYNYESQTVILKTYVRPIRTIILQLDNHCEQDTRLIITNVDDNAYKYKLFEKEKSMHVLSPTKGFQIEFDGSHFYGKIQKENSTHPSPSYALFINVFKDIPPYVNHLKIHSSSVEFKNEVIIPKNNNVLVEPSIIEELDLLTYSFFDNLLYKKHLTSFQVIQTITHCSQNKYIQIIKPTVKMVTQTASCKNDINILIDLSNNVSTCNRFLQRFTKNMYSINTCNWIMDEYSKSNDKSNVWSIEKMPNVFNYVLFSFKEIIEYFIQSYCLDSEIKISITSGEIIKYQSNDTNESIGSGISCIIVMSKKADIIFNDGLKYKLNQGDILLYKKQNFEVNVIDDAAYISLFDITVGL